MIEYVGGDESSGVDVGTQVSEGIDHGNALVVYPPLVSFELFFGGRGRGKDEALSGGDSGPDVLKVAMCGVDLANDVGSVVVPRGQVE